MPSQIVPAASLRNTTRLPAARGLVWTSNHLILMILWSIARVVLRVGSNFLPALREGAHLGPWCFRRDPPAPKPPAPSDRTAPESSQAAVRPAPASPGRER